MVFAMLSTREVPLKFTICAGVPLDLYFEKEKRRGIPTTKKNHNLDTTVPEHGLSLIQSLFYKYLWDELQN